MKSRTISIMVAIACAVLLSSEARAAYACGTYIADSCKSCSQWTGAMSNGACTGGWCSCAGSSSTGLRYQCVELAQRFYNVLWGYPGIWSGVSTANQMCTYHPGGIYKEASSCGNFWHGDLMVWPSYTCGTGSAGHVAVVDHCDTWGSGSSYVVVTEQNWSVQGAAHVNPACGSCGLWTNSNPWRYQSDLYAPYGINYR
jgi:CHAP domain